MNSTRRLEEILEECITAHLEGRRSLAECLSLYPSYARELEPLLRTAVGLNTALQATPPAYMQQRGLQNFLSAARDRRNLKTLTAGSSARNWLSGLLPQYRMAFAGAAVALAIAAVAAGAAFSGTFGGGGGGSESVRNPEDNPDVVITPLVVGELEQRVQVLQSRLERGERIDPTEISELTNTTKLLQEATLQEIDEQRELITQVLNTAATQLDTIKDTQPEAAAAAEEAGEIVRDVAGGFNIPIGGATPAATEAATPTPAPTNVTVTDAPTAPPTGAPTAAPTPEPEPSTTSAATEEPDIRNLPGLPPLP
jgi:hypothetical protein